MPCEKINGNEAIKLKIAETNVVYMLLSQLAFVCCTEATPTNELKQALKMSSNRSTSKTRQVKITETSESEIAKSLSNISDMLTAMKMSNDANSMEIGKKLDDVHVKANDICKHTTTLVNKATRPFQFQSNTVPTSITPKPAKRIELNSKTPTPSFADALRKNVTHQSAKRLRTDYVSKPNFNAPKPKIGTKKTAPTGLTIIAPLKRDEKPKFSKAIWISRFAASTTCDDISRLIVENTPIDDKSKFNVHKLVKKDKDLATLKFVSFKIEVNDEDFETLIDPDVWPENMLVREFLRDRTFGDFLNFPDLNAKRNRKSSLNAIDMEIQQSEMNLTPSQKSPTQP